MKKSRIILPAAALLALSSAAAVTGTVAWFTANRIKSVGFTGVTAVNPEQGLIVTEVTNVANTTVTQTPTGTITDATTWSVQHSQLRDASYDVGGNLYGSILSETGSVVGYAQKTIGTADTKKYNGQNVYFATRFTMTFATSREDNDYEQALIFDSKSSSVLAGQTGSIVNALRISMETTSESLVWAPYTSLAANAVKNVAEAKSSYDDLTADQKAAQTLEQYLASGQEATADVIKGEGVAGTGTNIPSDAAGKVETRTDVTNLTQYLGALTEGGLQVSITTWFEGLDPDCVNEAKDLASAFTANLQFTMRKVAKGA